MQAYCPWAPAVVFVELHPGTRTHALVEKNAVQTKIPSTTYLFSFADVCLGCNQGFTQTLSAYSAQGPWERWPKTVCIHGFAAH